MSDDIDHENRGREGRVTLGKFWITRLTLEGEPDAAAKGGSLPAR
jgi:hypothetical protein